MSKKNNCNHEYLEYSQYTDPEHKLNFCRHCGRNKELGFIDKKFIKPYPKIINVKTKYSGKLE